MALSKKPVLGLLALAVQVSSCSLDPRNSRLAEGEAPESLRVGVYTVVDGQDKTSLVALMGPFVQGDTSVLKAVELKGCADTQEAWRVLGIDRAVDTHRLFTEEDSAQFELSAWDAVNPDREIFQRDYGLGEVEVNCKAAVPQARTWYWDVGTGYYFPNFGSPNGDYLFVPESCEPLAQTLEAGLSPDTKEIVFGLPFELEGRTRPIACGGSIVASQKSPWGWSLSYSRSVNHNNFHFTPDGLVSNHSVLLLSYRAPSGELSEFSILSINGQKLPSSRTRVFNDELKARLQSFVSKVAPVLPALTTMKDMAPSPAEEIRYRDVFTSIPVYEVCLDNAPADCQTKAFWASETTVLDPEEDPSMATRSFLLTPAKIKLTEKAIVNRKVGDVITITKPNSLEILRITAEPCGAYDLFGAFAANLPAAKSPDLLSLEDLKKESLTYIPAFRPVVAQQAVTCDYPQALVCRVTASDEASLTQALSAAQCSDQAVVLDVEITADLNLSRPLDVLVDANTPRRINRFTEIKLRGRPISENDVNRHPVITKTYGNPAFRSLLKFSGIARVSLEDLVITSRLASMDQTALSFIDVRNSALDNVKIQATTPATAFTLGVSLRNTRLAVNRVSIDAANIGIQAQSSRIIARSRENRIATYRPMDTKAIELNRSLLAADGLSLVADSNASLNGTSVLLTQALKLKGNDPSTSLGFIFQNGASYALISEKAEFQDFYTEVWADASAVKSEVKVATAICANVQNPTDKICKKP